MGCTQSTPARDLDDPDSRGLLGSDSDRGHKARQGEGAYNTATMKGVSIDENMQTLKNNIANNETQGTPQEKPKTKSILHKAVPKSPNSNKKSGQQKRKSSVSVPHWGHSKNKPPPPLLENADSSGQQSGFSPLKVSGSPLNPAMNTGNTGPHKMPPTSKPMNRALDRTDAIDKSRTITIGGITMTYAYLSQRGFYPDDPFKANQDAYCVHSELRKKDGLDDAFFGVFDGHGKDGDHCAIYTKHNMPPNLAAILRKTPPNQAHKEYLSKDQIQNALVRAHVDVNKGLHKNPNIDDTLSGTTAISIYFHGGMRNRITVSNVGDSRAVLATLNRTSGALKALPLSRDQTPYRKDERARIKATGARVLSLDQLEGLEPILDASDSFKDDEFELGEDLDEGGDPPRVWHPKGDYPGTAFTRSVGDSVAEELGVFAEPEMLTREIMPDDKIIVLASDGVYEFLTNQSVIDICAKFKDPLEACRAVVAEAYELWLQYELRTDDITIICIFVDKVVGCVENRRGSLGDHSVMSQQGGPESASFRLDSAKGGKGGGGVAANMRKAASAASSSCSSGGDDDVDHDIQDSGFKPVRKHASKEKSKAIAKWKELGKTMHGDDPYDDKEFDWKKHATDKTEEEKRSISDAIKASVMFRNTNEEQRQMIYACMESVDVKKGTWVIQQGSVGDRFYIVDEGQFEVRIVPDGEEDETGQGGHIVHIYEGSREKHAHPSFGELALVHSMPRSASVVAKTDGHLWALHRAAFRQVLVEAQDHRKELKRVLHGISYFEHMDVDAINKLATMMDEVTFGRGENIINQDDKGTCMFVMASGSASGTQIVHGETKRTNYKAGSHFGTEILVTDSAKYLSTVSTLQTTICWQLDKKVLMQTMGPLLQRPGGS